LSARDADLDAEQEVDLARYWNAIVARWWLPLAGLLVGALIGYLISLGGGQVWRASSTVYVGASYSIIGGALLQGPQSNPSAVGTIARAESSIERAAVLAGMKAADLRGNVSTQTISTGVGANIVRTTGNPLVRITVEASTRRRAQFAANALADIVVGRLAGYANRKIDRLRERIDADREVVNAIRQQSRTAGDATAKAVFAIQLGEVLENLNQAEQLLIQAEEIEKPQIFTRAAAAKTTARSRRNSVVVAAFLGLLLGLVAALAWDRLPRP
jgi:uncharacterized protein involved in exopolysaccharide biosynthesis